MDFVECINVKKMLFNINSWTLAPRVLNIISLSSQQSPGVQSFPTQIQDDSSWHTCYSQLQFQNNWIDLFKIINI